MNFNKIIHTMAFALIANAATADEPWKASWIRANAAKASEHTIEVSKALYGVAGDPAKQIETNGPQADPNANQWTCFRTEIDLEKAPTSAIARIAADSKYWLWINGKLTEATIHAGPRASGKVRVVYGGVPIQLELNARKNATIITEGPNLRLKNL